MNQGEDTICWSELLKVPFPQWALTIMWQVVVHFWSAEMGNYKVLPTKISDVKLRVDHNMYNQRRYHIYKLRGEEAVGIWDETPFWVEYNNNPSFVFLEHGDPKHAFKLFLQSFLLSIGSYVDKYPSLHILYKIIKKLPILQWQCSICNSYNQWAHEFIHEQHLSLNYVIEPSFLILLLSYRNKKLMQEQKPRQLTSYQCKNLLEIMTKALTRFFSSFQKIQEQTRTDPILLLKNIIDIVQKYDECVTEDIPKIEQQCSKEIKCFLYSQLKFLRTKSVHVYNFPRDLLISRDIIALLKDEWVTNDIVISSPGMFIMMSFLLCNDQALDSSISSSSPIILVKHSENIIRHMTPPELDQIRDYHPLIRPQLFMSHNL